MLAGNDRGPAKATISNTQCRAADPVNGKDGRFMTNTENFNLIQQVAGRYGVDGDTVRNEIREAMRAARQSESAAAKAFWKGIPENASELDLVLHISRILCAG